MVKKKWNNRMEEDGSFLSEDRASVVEVDTVLLAIGSSPLQQQCLILLGLANAADAVEVLAIGYIITVFKDPTTGADIDSIPGWSSVMTSGVFIGMLFGGIFSGMYGDKWGRKPLLIASLGLNGVAGILSSATLLLPAHIQVPWLVLFRVIGGVGVGGSVPATFALTSELVSGDWRGFYINIVACFWSIGTLYTAIIAYMILHWTPQNWPLFALLVALPAVVSSILCILILEESPVFLWTNGRLVECAACLNRLNDSSNSISNYERQLIASKIETLAPPPMQPAPSTRMLVEGILAPDIRRRTLYVCLLFFFLSFAHYGISSWVSDIFKKLHFSNIYATSFFYALATVPGLLSALYWVDKVGRKHLVVWSMLGSFISAILFATFSSSSKLGTTVGAAMFNAFSACAWNGVDIFSAELFPSSLRGTALGWAGACGRLGSVLGTVFNSLQIAGGSESAVWTVLITAGVSMLLGAKCAHLLPETFIW